MYMEISFIIDNFSLIKYSENIGMSGAPNRKVPGPGKTAETGYG